MDSIDIAKDASTSPMPAGSGSLISGLMSTLTRTKSDIIKSSTISSSLNRITSSTYYTSSERYTSSTSLRSSVLTSNYVQSSTLKLGSSSVALTSTQLVSQPMSSLRHSSSLRTSHTVSIIRSTATSSLRSSISLGSSSAVLTVSSKQSLIPSSLVFSSAITSSLSSPPSSVATSGASSSSLSTNNSKKNTIIIAVVVSVCGLIIISLVSFFFYRYLKRRKRNANLIPVAEEDNTRRSLEISTSLPLPRIHPVVRSTRASAQESTSELSIPNFIGSIFTRSRRDTLASHESALDVNSLRAGTASPSGSQTGEGSGFVKISGRKLERWQDPELVSIHSISGRVYDRNGKLISTTSTDDHEKSSPIASEKRTHGASGDIYESTSSTARNNDEIGGYQSNVINNTDSASVSDSNTNTNINNFENNIKDGNEIVADDDKPSITDTTSTDGEFFFVADSTASTK
ncbi:hypothetical protein V1511DRAFT_511510 [Dipodascopsis uninucleata]